MSAVTTRRLPRLWWLGAAVLVLLAISVLRVVTGAEDLASSGTVRATLIALVPIMLAGLGGLWSERAGVVNIGLEGMMVLGTYGAGYFGYHYGAWAGVAGALLMGAIGGLIHATATVVFGVDHIISGVAINIIAVGAVQYLASLTFVGLPGGGQTQSPKLDNVGSITIGPLSDALGEVEDQDIFFVSELAAVARAMVTNLSLLVVLAFVLLFVTYWVLWRTSFGLRLRSTGEKLPPPKCDNDPVWPDLELTWSNVPVALARPFPGFSDFDEVREIEALYLEAIARATDLLQLCAAHPPQSRGAADGFMAAFELLQHEAIGSEAVLDLAAVCWQAPLMPEVLPRPRDPKNPEISEVMKPTDGIGSPEPDGETAPPHFPELGL